MAQQVNLGYALWMDGETFNAQLGRTAGVASYFQGNGSASASRVLGGIVQGISSMAVLPGSGMSVTVASGSAVVPNSSSALQGAYMVENMTQVTLTLTASDPINPRLDLVCLTVVDNGDSTSYSEVQVLTGVAAVSPYAPALPANSLALALVSVAARTTSVTTSNITDMRQFTAAAGGIVPWKTASAATGGTPGLLAYDITAGRFFHNNGYAAQVNTLPWPPVYATKNTSTSMPTDHAGTLLSQNINCDGKTDIKVTTHWPGFYISSPGAAGSFEGILTVMIDGVQLDITYLYIQPSTVPQAGGTNVYTTSSASADTPTSGPHTIAWMVEVAPRGGATGTPYIQANVAGNAYLRVEPVVL